MWVKQREAFDRVVRRGTKGTGLLMEMGTGKTRVMVEAIEVFRPLYNVNLILVIANLSGMHVWVENWHKWADFPALFIDLQDTGTRGLRQAQKLAAEGQLVICLINYEMAWQIGHKYMERTRQGEPVRILEPVDTVLYDLDWDMVILDEATYIGNVSTKVSRFILRKLRARARMRFFLTGSGYTKSPLKLYAMLRWGWGDQYVPPTFTLFKSKFTIPHPMIRGAIIGYQNIAALAEVLRKCCILLKKEDVLDLPTTLDQTYLIELPPKAAAIYKKITDECFADLEEFCAQGGTVTAKHIFSIMRKQLQIAAGHIMPDADDPDVKPEPIDLHDCKIKVVLDILELREGKPTILVTQSDHMEVRLAAAIKKKFDYTPKILNGSVKGAEARHKMTADAGKDGSFIVKESVGAMALDMQYADMTIFVEHSANTSNYEQIRSRNHRGEQDKKITYIHILAKGTADMRVMKILEGDLDVARQLEKNWRALL